MQTDQNLLETVELPADLSTGLQEVTERDVPPETLEAGITAVESMMEAEGFEITVDQMYQPEPTRHAVHIGERVEHVPCVLDALITGLLVDPSPVEIRSECPASEQTVQMTVAGSDVSVDPSTAVFSWGWADEDVQNPDPETALNDAGTVSLASCSYINAFPDEATYQRWQGQISDAVVMQLDHDSLVALAKRAADGWVVSD